MIVTLGEQGSLVYTHKERLRIPCVDAGKTVDTTAAGDTYCGALCVKLAEGADLKEAASFASLCSGIAVTRRGAQVSVPTRAEAEALQKRIGSKE